MSCVLPPSPFQPTNPESIILIEPMSRPWLNADRWLLVSADAEHLLIAAEGADRTCCQQSRTRRHADMLTDMFTDWAAQAAPNPKRQAGCRSFFFFTLVAGPRRSLRLKLSDTRVYESQTRARLGTTTLAVAQRAQAQLLLPDVKGADSSRVIGGFLHSHGGSLSQPPSRLSSTPSL